MDYKLLFANVDMAAPVAIYKKGLHFDSNLFPRYSMHTFIKILSCLVSELHRRLNVFIYIYILFFQRVTSNNDIEDWMRVSGLTLIYPFKFCTHVVRAYTLTRVW